MKLYTEEEIKRVFELFQHSSSDITLYLQELTPIELPSDEEIKNKVNEISWIHPYYTKGFFSGIKFIKEQILNQNK